MMAKSRASKCRSATGSFLELLNPLSRVFSSTWSGSPRRAEIYTKMELAALLLALFLGAAVSDEPAEMKQSTAPVNPIGTAALTAISVSAGLITIYNQFELRVLPQPTTAQDTLEIVKRLQDLALPNDEPQYKHVEDTILRALNDMLSISTTDMTEMQQVLWLEKARNVDSEVILLLEALLGRTVASVDLLKNIKEHLRCDGIKITAKVNRFDALTQLGSVVFTQFAELGQMSALELSRRRAEFRERKDLVMIRNEAMVEECFQNLLTETVQQEEPFASSDEIAERVAEIMAEVYPLPTRWIVAVYTDERGQQINPGEMSSRAAVKPIKPKLSADYNLENIGGYKVALFPFVNGTDGPKMIDGRNIDAFCNRPVTGAGQMPTCDVGSSDGEYVYDELRRQRIVPDNHDLIVVPAEGRLSVRTVPLGSLPPFFAKNYPDFDIIVF